MTKLVEKTNLRTNLRVEKINLRINLKVEKTKINYVSMNPYFRK